MDRLSSSKISYGSYMGFKRNSSELLCQLISKESAP